MKVSSDIIIGNYNTSVVIPCNGEQLHQLDSFHPYYKNGVEIILAFPEKDANLALELPYRYPFINWKIIAVPEEIFNYSAFVNAALPWCERQYILLSGPGIVSSADYLHCLRFASDIYPGRFYMAGIDNPPAIINDDIIISDESFSCGPMLVSNQWLTAVNGLDEQLSDQFFSLLNLKSRLEKRGHSGMLIPQANCKYIHDQPDLNFECFRHYYYQPADRSARQPGKSARLIFHWRNKPALHPLLEKYLTNFKKYELRDPDILKKRYKKILLAQCHNEMSNLQDFLDNMARYFDGFILLDDDSTDGSYEHMQHEKLLIKFQKERITFNDLENRNILLDIAGFFNTDWLCFMDIDERIDPRFSDFSSFEDRTDILSVIFNFVHCWKGELFYNAGLAGSKYGFEIRFRMFRNLGRMQITALTKLHFPAVPFTDGKYHSNILFLHLGNKSKQLRKKKYNFYREQDQDYDLSMYDFLVNEENPQLQAVKDIGLEDGKFYNVSYPP
jgi:hypothetical protein